MNLYTSISRSLRRSLLLAVCALTATPLAPDVWAQPTHQLGEDGDFIKLAEPDPSTPEGQLQLIRRTLVEGRAGRAEDMAEDWLDENPDHPMAVEAYLIRGDALSAQGDYYLALSDYEVIATLYPGSEQYVTALEREYNIAKQYLGGLRRRSSWTNLRIFPADDVGIELLIRIQERLPGSSLGERASIAIGDYYFDLGDMEMASEGYDLFLINYPNSRQREWAMLRLIQASLAKYKGPQFDPSGLTDAAQRLAEYQQAFPAAAEKIGAEALMIRITESLAEKKLVTAQWHERRGLERGAITLYRRVIKDYPGSAAAIEAVRELQERDLPLVDPRLREARLRDADPTEANDQDAAADSEAQTETDADQPDSAADDPPQENEDE